MEGTGTNIGPNQPVNTTRRITWNMAADWSVDFAQIQVEVLAKDSRNLLGVHWIKVPAVGEKPAIEISRKPISDAELLSIWYWFVATHHTGVTLMGGTVYGTTGMFSGARLASGTATTGYGRLFTYEQMGVRAITSDEITRAQAGSYGFSSVDSQSIVREPLAPTSLIFGWGDNSADIQTVPICAGNAVKVASGPWHVLALMTNGTVVTWGSSGTVPTGLTGVTAIAASDGGSFALKNNGTIVAWGGGAETSIPAGLTNVQTFAVGEEHGLAALKDGRVVCWGSDGGYGAISGLPSGLSNVVAVTAGYYFSVALKNDGTVVAWGYNGHGEINIPEGLTNVVEISAGRHHVVARKTDGTVVAWGRTNEGQLDVPPGLTNVVQVSAGGHTSMFTLARKSDGSVVAWGDNGSGQRNVPVGLAPTSYVAAGGGHSFVIVPAQ
jgi:alpha-tubulin suppressor-like RCC1 family protein